MTSDILVPLGSGKVLVDDHFEFVVIKICVHDEIWTQLEAMCKVITPSKAFSSCFKLSINCR